MAIFIHLAFKAEGPLQDEEEGDGDNKNNYTNVSLRLYLIIHQGTITSVAHTPPHPIHTLTHTTHTYLHRANQADMS